MIIKQYIKDFENLGFGMFVHFGIYSVYGRGEWSKHTLNVPTEEYEALAKEFDPKPTWAKELVATAKNAGCKYITLTSRHHDGFSLYDTCGLNDYDAPHAKCGRDLVREFVDACNAEGIIPFFYHTLLDWREPTYNTDFPAYLKYLRSSVELLCKNYGKIGGIWFDGMWNKPEEDWEEDAMYSMIRSYQPEAMIINNTGLGARGELGHIELDSVTFERGRPAPINMEGSPKYIASEMCQVFNSVWGYAKEDLSYVSPMTILEDLCTCRRYGSNLLLNIGPCGDGSVRPIDKAYLDLIGQWVSYFDEAIRKPRPCNIMVKSQSDDFLLKDDNTYYLFFHGSKMMGDGNVVISEDGSDDIAFTLPESVKSIRWMDDNTELNWTQTAGEVCIQPNHFAYGRHLVIRVAKIETKA